MNFLDKKKYTSTLSLWMCFFLSLSLSLSLITWSLILSIYHLPSAKLLTMEAIRFSNLSALLILLLLSQSLCVTSKDQTVSCTMCSSCDNPCNPVPTSSPPPPPTPPRSSGGSGGGSYYYSPPPPPSNSGGGKYPPPYGGYGDGGQSYYYPPASYGNYPTPPPPNPIVPYFPFYYHVPPPGDSGSDRLLGSLLFVIFSLLLCYG